MPDAPDEYPLVIHAQYIKDFSFENPGAPGIFPALAENPPEIRVNIDVSHAHLNERTYEVVLHLRIRATCGEKIAFQVELDYAGVAAVGAAVPESRLEPMLFVEVARHLFPFARGILAAASRDGGFPPLLLNPVDFEQYYQRHKKGALQSAAPAEDPVEAPAPAD